MQTGDISTKENLCDTCLNSYPSCNPPKDLQFGNGVGNDNIIECKKYVNLVSQSIKCKSSFIPDLECDNIYCVEHSLGMEDNKGYCSHRRMKEMCNAGKLYITNIKSAIPGTAGNSPASTPAQQSYGASSEQPAPYLNVRCNVFGARQERAQVLGIIDTSS